MHRISLVTFTGICTLLLLVSIGTLCLAQGSGSSRATPTPPKQPTLDEFATSLWKYINREQAPYRKWASAAPSEVPEVQSPHFGSGKVYFNDVAAKDWKQLPHGAIVLRDELDEDGKTLKAVSVMYRVKGTAPKNNDWYWLQFQPIGKLIRTPAAEGNKPVAGQVTSCIECHRKAPGGDFVFSNAAAPNVESAK